MVTTEPDPDPSAGACIYVASSHADVLHDVFAERVRAHKAWGPQTDLPDGTGPEAHPMPWAADARQFADYFRKQCQAAAADGTVTWRHVLLEEVFEAFAEPSDSDLGPLYTEVIQVVAVAIRWATAIRTRQAQALDELSRIGDHDFLPVSGHPDDDECTHRADGTDATYCGAPEHVHEWSER